MKITFSALLVVLFSVGLYSQDNDIKWLKPGHQRTITPICISPSGEIVASFGGENTLKIINIKTDSLLYYYPISGLSTIKFSIDNSNLTLGFFNSIQILNIDSKSIIRNINLESFQFKKYKISNNNKYIAGLDSNKTIKILGFISENNLKYINFDNDKIIYDFNFSPDGNSFFVLTNDSIKIYNTDNWSLSKSIYFIAFNRGLLKCEPHNRYLAVYYPFSRFNIIDIDSSLLLSVVDTQNEINDVCFTNDSKNLIILTDSIRFWDIDKGIYIKSFFNSTLNQSQGEPDRAMAYSETLSDTILITSNNSINLWDIRSGVLLKQLTNYYDKISFLNKGQGFYYNTNFGKFKIFDTEIFAFKKMVNSDYSGFIPDTNIYFRYFSIDNKGQRDIEFFDLNTDKSLESFHFDSIIGDIEFSSGLKYCNLTTLNHTNNFYKWCNKSIVFTLNDYYTKSKFSKKGTYALILHFPKENQPKLDIVNLDIGKIISTFDSIPANSIYYTSENEKLLYLYIPNRSFTLYNLENGQIIKELSIEISVNYPINKFLITKDDKYIIDVNGKEIRIWNIESKKCEKIYSEYGLDVASFDISYDNKYIIATYIDGSAILYIFPFLQVAVKSNEIVSQLFGIYPNPSNNNFNLQYFIDNYSNVKISLYNSIGGLCEILLDGNQERGSHNLNLTLSDKYSPGLYWVRLETDKGEVISKPVVIMR